MVWRYLPNARSRLLAVTAALVAVFYGAIAVGFALNVMKHPVGLVVCPLFALLAWGTWSLSRFARWVTIVWLWVMVILLPFGVFQASTSGDAGVPYWGTLLASVTPLVVLALFFIYVFGKHKREFKWP
jgi:hypothetical protein